MVYQGVVMEVEKNYIIVLTDDTNYVKLKQKGYIDIGKKIMFIEDDIIRKSNNSFKPLIGIAAAIILVIATIIGQFGIDFMKNFQAYAIVSLDINPSLEFQIDEKEMVKKINFLNKDGREIIDDNMVGMQIEDAIILSIKKAINKQYLNNENNVVLVSDVVLDDNAEITTVIENKIFEKVTEDKELQDIDLIYVNSDKEDFGKSRENQISIGKYKIYKIISDHKPDVEVEDIKDKKVSVIVKENMGLTKSEEVKTNKEEKKEEKKIEKEKKNKEAQIEKKDKNEDNKFNGNDNKEKGNSKSKEKNSSKKDIKGKNNKNIENKEDKEEDDDDDDDDDDDEDDDDEDNDEEDDDEEEDEDKNSNSKKNIKENKGNKNKNKSKKGKKNNSKKNIEEDDDDHDDDDEDDDD